MFTGIFGTLLRGFTLLETGEFALSGRTEVSRAMQQLWSGAGAGGDGALRDGVWECREVHVLGYSQAPPSLLSPGCAAHRNRLAAGAPVSPLAGMETEGPGTAPSKTS